MKNTLFVLLSRITDDHMDVDKNDNFDNYNSWENYMEEQKTLMF